MLHGKYTSPSKVVSLKSLIEYSNESFIGYFMIQSSSSATDVLKVTIATNYLITST